MTAPRTPVEALAWATADALCYDGEECERMHDHIWTAGPTLAALRDKGWHLIDAPTLAARLHQDCLDTSARREAARPGGQYTQHRPDAHLDEARRLLGGGG